MAPMTMPKVALDHELSSWAFDKEITKCTTKKQHMQKQGKQIRKFKQDRHVNNAI